MSSTSFKMSQGFEVLKPKQDKAIPIPCKEWDIIKMDLAELNTEPWLFHTIGSILIGACLATSISIMTGSVAADKHPHAEVVAWAVVVVCGLVGIAALYFAHKERAIHRSKAKRMLALLGVIEMRFDRSDTNAYIEG